MSRGWGSLNMGDLWESKIGLVELSSAFSDDVLVVNNDGLHDVDGLASCAVSTSHFRVHLRDSSAKGSISVLFVHVHVATSALVSKNDSVVLD